MAVFSNIWAFLKRVGHFIKNVFKLFKIVIFDKLKYKTVDEAINGYNFDFGYLYNLEYAKLDEMRNYFQKHGYSIDNDQYVKQIELAMKLLNIINNDNYLYEYIEDKTSTGKTLYERSVYKSLVNVNTKNANRFSNNDYEIEMFKKWPHELYLRKAKYLYHRMREEYEQYWWD